MRHGHQLRSHQCRILGSMHLYLYFVQCTLNYVVYLFACRSICRSVCRSMCRPVCLSVCTSMLPTYRLCHFAHYLTPIPPVGQAAVREEESNSREARDHEPVPSPSTGGRRKKAKRERRRRQAGEVGEGPWPQSTSTNQAVSVAVGVEDLACLSKARSPSCTGRTSVNAISLNICFC